ncbi:hypothetical protein NAV33_07390 [Pseudomonas stutzeri]|uniref:hypothetical protein n=1 Tax=Stutzerimonas stutzeri TaxID=316 RepID=UPI00210CB93D|nr:hypothetical protein [Stutzerimonas stutzeri]MCQ4311718.1 hypothetical protein [Stutzerimonas stutzeri]
MCNCKAEMEEMLAGQIMGSLPVGAEGLNVQLGGFGLLVGADRQLEHKNQAEITISYQVPAKSGVAEMKTKKQKMMLTGNFCMFCGERYSREHAPKVD